MRVGGVGAQSASAEAAESDRRRPAQARSRYLVDVIFEAAQKLLASAPLERITTSRIAEVAGVSVGSLYQYFNNRESVLRGLMERRLREDLDEVLGAMDRQRRASLGDLLRDVVDTVVHLHTRDRKAHARILMLVPLLGKFAFVREAVAEMRTAMREDLEARRHEVRDGDADIMSFVGGVAVEQVVNAAVLERPELLDDPRFADEILLLVTRYYARD